MKLAILAKGKTLARFSGSNGYDEVWGLNQQSQSLDLDRCFVMDDLVYRMPLYAGHEFVEWLKTYTGRIITSRKYDDWPCEEYPIQDVCVYYGLPLGVSMYSTIDYMIALAVMEGWNEIDLYGVDNVDSGSPEMRASTALWIGVAMSRGVKVNTFQGSFYQFWTNLGIGMEFGLYGYTYKPRVENLVRPNTP